MDELQLPRDFSDFLRLLNSARVEYLLVGGYAVGLHGYPRATGDMDILVAADPENAEKVVRVLLDFGFSPDTINQEMFEKQRQVVRMGRPPVAIDVLTSASGIDFSECYSRRQQRTIDGVEVSVIDLADLRTNKQASGRPKDLDDLENLPSPSDA